MINQTTISIFGSTLGNVLGFVAKQPIIFRGMNAVRRELERCVETVALRHPGSPLMAAQAIESLAIPLTCVIGDVMWTCVSHGVLSIVTLAAKISGLVKDEFRNSFLSRTIIGIASSTIGYTWKYVVATCAHPAMRIVLQRLSQFPSVLFPASLVAYAPAITIVLADIGGFILTEAIYHISLHIFSSKQT